MRTFLRGGTLVAPDEILSDHCLIIQAGRIRALVPEEEIDTEPDDEVLRADGMWVAPGMIDIHIHGCAGADTLDASPEALGEMGRFLASHGVTAFLPTTVSAGGAAIAAAIDAFRAALPKEGGAEPLGLHLEGPYINPRLAGAQPEAHVRLPNPDEYTPWLESGAVKLVTLAPELDGAIEMIRRGRAQGVRFSAGHTEASYEVMLDAADAGLSLAAHLFNAMAPLHHRSPGVVAAALTDERIFAEIIADGVHIHPAVVRLALRARGLERILLVSDAMRAAGLPDGEYDLGGQQIAVQGGIALTQEGRLAGSTLTLDAAVRNTMSYAGLSFPQALRLVTRNPAEALGLAGLKGVLLPGADADVVLFDQELQARLTMVRGRVVYRR